MIEINNTTNHTVDKKSFSTVAKIVLKGENRGTETISLAFVGKAEIKKLNKKFRKKNKPTDVLSFDLKDRNVLGEVVICPEIVKEKKENIIEVFIHGILHLCGYDHPATAGSRSRRDEKKAELMETKQEKYLSKVS